MFQKVTKRNWMIGAGAAALVLLVVLFAATGSDDPDTSAEGARPTAVERDTGSADETSTATGTVTSTTPLVATTESGELIPPKSTSKKSGAAAVPSTPDTPPAPATPEEAAYLEETKKVVETNASELALVAESVTEALSNGDGGDLSTLLASDEGDQSEFVETMASAYPPMDSTQLGSNVNVFASEETTLYFAYVIVTWTDGGITSQHTIPIVLRFIDGEWRLSTLGEDGSDLDFVQSVAL